MSQTKPETRCPVCGREFILIGSFWQCYVEDGDYHIISGPCNDPAGEKIDAMVRAMRWERPKMTLAEAQGRIERIRKARKDIAFFSGVCIRQSTFCPQNKNYQYLCELFDPDLFGALINKYIAAMRQIITDECAALGVEVE